MKTPRWVFFFYLGVAAWLTVYFATRYQGNDFGVYVNAGRAAWNAFPLYQVDDLMTFRYFPSVAFLFIPFAFVPDRLAHFLGFLLGLSALLRASWLISRLALEDVGSKRISKALWVLPIFLGLQAIGAQIETGNINAVLIALFVEGFYRYVKNQKTVGIAVLLGLTLFKPQFGALPFFLLILDGRKPQALKVWLQGSAFVVGAVGVTLVVQGSTWFLEQVHQWIKVNQAHSELFFTNRFSAGNLSLYSFAYEFFGFSATTITLALLLPAVVLCTVKAIQLQNHRLALCSASLLVFVFSPVSFLFTFFLVTIPMVFLAAEIFGNGLETKIHLKIIFTLGLLACFGTSFVVVGRHLFQDLVVPYRLHAWLALPLFFFVPKRLRAV